MDIRLLLGNFEVSEMRKIFFWGVIFPKKWTAAGVQVAEWPRCNHEILIEYSPTAPRLLDQERFVLTVVWAPFLATEAGILPVWNCAYYSSPFTLDSIIFPK